MLAKTVNTKTILLADDHEGIKRLTADMLRCLGFEVVTCRNGVEVLSYYRLYEGNVDLVFLDLIMPVMNGYECMCQLKKYNPGLPVVLFSGYLNHQEIAKSMKAGADFFLEKPFELKKLAWVIHEVMSDIQAEAA